MTAPELFPYQCDVEARVANEIANGRRRILIPLPTGGGKTVLAAAIIREHVEQKRRVLVLVHRRELTRQMSGKLLAQGVDHGIIQAGFPMRPGERAQVASVQTLAARAIRSRAIELPLADLIIVDEAHHVRAETYQRILECYPEAIILGLTATPCRGDGRGLGTVFDVMVQCPSVAELITGKYLVPSKMYAPTRPDLQGVRIERGDYAEQQLAERMDQPKLVGDIVEHWHRLGERRPTVCFATGVNHSVHLRDEFRRSGVVAEHIDGSTPVDERDAILRRLASGEAEVVCNCAVLTEGWDCPAASCLILARPTKSLGLYRQMAGRVLRPATGKSDAIILDHSGAVFAHGFPEDPIQWELSADRRAVNAAHARRGKSGPQGMPRLTTCPECDAVRFEGKRCGVCGWRPQPKPESFETAEGNLGHVKRGAGVRLVSRAEKLDFYAMLLGHAQDRGYARGWAAHKYREKFGDWPPYRSGDVEPKPPDDTTRSWIRSRQIAYAKAMEKQRGVA